MNCTGTLIESRGLKSVKRYLEDVGGGTMHSKQESYLGVPNNNDGIPATAFNVSQQQK